MDNNERKPTGDIVHIFNRYFNNQVLDVVRVHGDLRVFASRNQESGKLSLFVLNKGDQSQSISLRCNNAEPLRWTELRYHGRDPEDVSPKLSRVGQRQHAQTLMVDCPPMSLTILHQ